MVLVRPSLGTVRALVWGAALWIFLQGSVVQISANPTGGVVVLGDAQIQSAFPGLTTIHQQTDRAVIDWSTFNIASGEHTNFIVPDVTSATLNRVLDGGPSLLNGTLTSNGQLFLTDLGSSNGSFVRLNGEAEVVDGDILLMGQQLFRIGT